MGWQDGTVSEGACCQTWWPEFDTRPPCGKRRELSPEAVLWSSSLGHGVSLLPQHINKQTNQNEIMFSVPDTWLQLSYNHLGVSLPHKHSLLLVSAQVLVERHLCAVPADHTKGSLLVTAPNFDPLTTTLRHTLSLSEVFVLDLSVLYFIPLLRQCKSHKGRELTCLVCCPAWHLGQKRDSINILEWMKAFSGKNAAIHTEVGEHFLPVLRKWRKMQAVQWASLGSQEIIKMILVLWKNGSEGRLKDGRWIKPLGREVLAVRSPGINRINVPSRSFWFSFCELLWYNHLYALSRSLRLGKCRMPLFKAWCCFWAGQRSWQCCLHLR